MPPKAFPIKRDEIRVSTETYDTGFHVVAHWRNRLEIGLAVCLWEDNHRLFIADLRVSEMAPIRGKRLFRKPIVADFRGQGIGTILLRETIKQARERGATELYGKVIAEDVANASFDLLGWYQSNGFELREPIDDFPPGQVARIVMTLS